MLKLIYRWVNGYSIKASKKLSRKIICSFLEQEFSTIEANSDVLNVGSGGDVESLLANYAKENNFFVKSFDIDETRKPDILGDICQYDFGQEDIFDCIVMSEVLEHLHSPHLAISNIQKILKPNGKLVITVPFIFPIHDRPYDYYRYTKYGLHFLLKNFQEIQVEERNSWGEAINVLFVRLVMEKTKAARICAPIVVFIAFTMTPVWLLMAKIIPSDFLTTGYVVTARK